MNLPIPFIYRNIEGNLHCVPSDLLDIFTSKPIVLSIRSKHVQGNSTFLNKIFKCGFEVESSSSLHNGSVDIQLDSMGFHIADLHGNVFDSLDVASTMIHMTNILLFHVNIEDLMEQREQLLTISVITISKFTFLTL